MGKTGATPPLRSGEDAPWGRSGWTDALIVAFLALQIGMTLPYYLGWRGDDERFSWRMFSSLYARDCRVLALEWVEGERRKIDLDAVLTSAWIEALTLARPAVVEKFLPWRCERSGATSIEYVRFCRAPDGTPVASQRATAECATADISWDRMSP